MCSDGILSEIMPDIAMATSSMMQMSIHDLDITPPPGDDNSPHQVAGHDLIPQHPGDLELDLGDGGSHSASGTMYI